MIHYSKIPYTIFRPHNIYGARMGMSVYQTNEKKMHFNNDGEVEVFSPHMNILLY